MDRPIGKMQSHRPVVRGRVDDMGHSGVDGTLAWPDVSGDIRGVFGNVPENGNEVLAVFLIAAL